MFTLLMCNYSFVCFSWFFKNLVIYSLLKFFFKVLIYLLHTYLTTVEEEISEDAEIDTNDDKEKDSDIEVDEERLEPRSDDEDTYVLTTKSMCENHYTVQDLVNQSVNLIPPFMFLQKF